MSRRSNKVGFLLIGLLIGFIVGVALLYWKFEAIDKLLFAGDEQDKVSTTDDRNGTADLLSMEQNAPEKNNKYVRDPRMSDTTIHSLEEFLEIFKGEFPDSVLIATYNRRFENTANGEDVVVMKDQLLFEREIKIAGMVVSDEKNLDSLLVDDPSSKKKTEVIRVEFWKSPINYKGYKMDENKIVLFGILEYNEASLKWSDGHLYLGYKSEYFPLDRTDAFRSFVILKDAQLIRRLNSL